MDFEEVLAAVKSFGKFQKRFFAITLLVIFPTAIIDIMFAFTQYETSFHCGLPSWINVSRVTMTEFLRIANRVRSFVTRKLYVKAS